MVKMCDCGFLGCGGLPFGLVVCLSVVVVFVICFADVVWLLEGLGFGVSVDVFGVLHLCGLIC